MAGVRVEQGRKRVRALVDGVAVVDTAVPRYVFEIPYYPTYYVPRADVRGELVDTGRRETDEQRGEGHVLDLRAGERVLQGAVTAYPDSPVAELRDLVRLDWDAADEWLEEDEPIYFHPRSPYARIDVLASSRHVRVEVDGTTVAESRQPRILFETGLPPRYYLPMTDVRMDLLRPTATVTHCPYKGDASWWSVVLDGEAREDLAWAYRSPFPEATRVQGLVAFYDEKVDLYLDGERQGGERVPHARPAAAG